MPGFILRDAEKRDIPALLALEAASFAADRLSSRSFRRLIGGGTCACRVADAGQTLAGYALVLYRSGSRVGRLYSIAVARGWQGAGVGSALLADAEAEARRRGLDRLRLEVRPDNRAAIRLYIRRGYRDIGRRPDFYADGSEARLFEKILAPTAGEDRSPRDSGMRPAYIEPLEEVTPMTPRKAASSVPSHAEFHPPLR